MADLIPSQFVSPSSRPELNGELGLDLHEIAQSLGAEFKHVKAAFEKNINDYTGVEFSTHVDQGPIRGMVEVKSYVLSVEDAKFFVAGYNNEVGKAYRRWLIQCEKKLERMEVRFDTLLSDPDNAVKVFQELANQKRKAQELEAQLPRLEAERDQAIAQRHLIDDRRTASAMGTASALKKKNQTLSLENQTLRTNLSEQNPNQTISFEAYRILTGAPEMSSRHKGLMFKRLVESGWVPEFKFIGNEPYPSKCFPMAAFDSYFNKLESFFGGL
jgi:phage anti-repressor protein